MSLMSLLLLLLLSSSSLLCAVATRTTTATSSSSSDEPFDGETYSEETLIKGLPDGSLLSHYQFTMTKAIDSEQQDPREELLVHHLFPKAIGQVVLEFDVQEFHLSLTQGRWQSQKWGSCSPLPLVASPPGSNSVLSFTLPLLLHRQLLKRWPIGAEVYAWFRPSNEENDAKTNDLWRGFTQVREISLTPLWFQPSNSVDITISYVMMIMRSTRNNKVTLWDALRFVRFHIVVGR